MKALRLEENRRAVPKIKVLREEGKKISLSIGFNMSHGRKIVQAFLKDLEAKISEYEIQNESLQIMKHQSLSHC